MDLACEPGPAKSELGGQWEVPERQWGLWVPWVMRSRCGPPGHHEDVRIGGVAWRPYGVGDGGAALWRDAGETTWTLINR